jgi:hypothetical protein
MANFNDPPEHYDVIHYLAQLLNEQAALKAGYAAGVRWGSLREDLKEKYFNDALRLFNEWRESEISNEKTLQQHRVEMEAKVIKVGDNRYFKL